MPEIFKSFYKPEYYFLGLKKQIPIRKINAKNPKINP
jgi:hypothetical protein